MALTEIKLFHKLVVEQWVIFTDIEPSPELLEYIKLFEANSWENWEKGNIEVIMIFHYKCAVCHSQFNHIKNYFNVTFKKGQNTYNKQLIADRILAVEWNSPLGQELRSEAEAFSRKIGSRSYKIDSTPTFLDVQTHIKVQESTAFANRLKIMLDRRSIDKQRKEEFIPMLERTSGPDCDAVACKMDEKVKIKGKK